MAMMTYILIGIAAYTFTNILLDPDMIFGWYNKLLDKLPLWLAKPLGKCEYCLAGQLAFWYFLVKNFNDYSIDNHVLMVSLSIFIVELINLYTAKNGN